MLLVAPEPITVMAEVPDGPPLRFTWRRVEHRVVAAEGPERIEAEWWRALGERRREVEAPRTAVEPGDCTASDRVSGARSPHARSCADREGKRNTTIAQASAGGAPVGELLGEPVALPSVHRPRDYYRIEDVAGGRYWVFRLGLYGRGGEDGAPRWFMHGLFG